MAKVFRIGTRTSPLALKQVEEVINELKKHYCDITFEIKAMDVYGDKNKMIPLSQIEGTDFFTREIDEALLRGEFDFAIHSAKDLPDKLLNGLFIAAITSSIDIHDVLVSKDKLKLDEFPLGTKVGTSSERRKTQLKRYREDLQIVDIRGNIGERLEKLHRNDLDAILIAAAGLMRLGLEEKITQRLPLDIMQPHPLQGALAVVVREEDLALIDYLSVLDKRERSCS